MPFDFSSKGLGLSAVEEGVRGKMVEAYQKLGSSSQDDLVIWVLTDWRSGWDCGVAFFKRITLSKQVLYNYARGFIFVLVFKYFCR